MIPEGVRYVHTHDDYRDKYEILILKYEEERLKLLPQETDDDDCQE